MLSGKEQPVTVNKDPKAKQAALFDNLAEKKVVDKWPIGVSISARSSIISVRMVST